MKKKKKNTIFFKDMQKIYVMFPHEHIGKKQVNKINIKLTWSLYKPHFRFLKIFKKRKGDENLNIFREHVYFFAHAVSEKHRQENLCRRHNFLFE